MPSLNLTSKFLEAVKPTPGRQVAYPDRVVRGLEMRVTPEGRKVWSLRYRTHLGKQRRVTLGVFPSVDLGDARDAAKKVVADVAGGGDPASDARRAKLAAKAEPIKTFDDLADAYLLACETGLWKPRRKQKRERTLADERGSLKRHIRPALGKFALEDITRADVRRFLEKMHASGIGAQTNKAHQVIRMCFAYAIGQGRVELNPATGFDQVALAGKRVRVLTDAELRTLWTTLINPTALRLPPKDGETKGVAVYVGRPMRIAAQLALLLLQRRGEIAGMHMSELDLDHATWLIPAERMKGGAPHMVPLPPMAVALIREALDLGLAAMTDDQRRAAPNDRPVFPSPRDPAKSVKPDSLTHVVVNLATALGVTDATPHDLRRTGSTLMTSERLGVSPFIRSKVLGHSTDTGGGAAVSSAHYDANTYAADKRKALAAWEGLLLEIVGEPAKASPDAAAPVQ